MMTPLFDRVVIKLDDTIPNKAGMIIRIVTDAWRAKDQAVESFNRGTVVSVGPGKRDPETLIPYSMRFDAGDCIRTLQAGDVVRFSELEYPEFKEGGERYVLICQGDIVGVEVDDAVTYADSIDAMTGWRERMKIEHRCEAVEA